MFLRVRDALVNIAHVSQIYTHQSGIGADAVHYVRLAQVGGGYVVYSSHASGEEASGAMDQLIAGDFSRAGESLYE